MFVKFINYSWLNLIFMWLSHGWWSFSFHPSFLFIFVPILWYLFSWHLFLTYCIHPILIILFVATFMDVIRNDKQKSERAVNVNDVLFCNKCSHETAIKDALITGTIYVHSKLILKWRLSYLFESKSRTTKNCV